MAHETPPSSPPLFKRFEENPIIRPNTENVWETKATFNPAALFETGKVHLLYRAIGEGDVSVLGYAASADGRTVDERLSEPVYTPEHFFGKKISDREGPSPLGYISGGGWQGGCEDPRLTRIGERVYMTFTAFNGWDAVWIALTSIGLEDFLAKRWKWEKPVFLSPPGEMHKNWVLFPEKIRGKFAILHSIAPEISIEYVDDLSVFAADDVYIRSQYGKTGRKRSWDNWMRGAGPPPLKTSEGWLLLYHAMDARDPDRYKLGAMLLDLEYPEKVLARSVAPVLEPDAVYENEGFKSGVIYCCGAVVKDGELIVYYGGADTVVCAAAAPLEAFLEELKRTGTPKLKPFPIAALRKPHARR